ncbi:hypothetical protein Hdeb2414_s0003g00115891 [Helianthus debilis subsp. tardiflorus]
MNHLSFKQLVARKVKKRQRDISRNRKRGWRSGIKRGRLSVMETIVKLPSLGGGDDDIRFLIEGTLHTKAYLVPPKHFLIQSLSRFWK